MLQPYAPVNASVNDHQLLDFLFQETIVPLHGFAEFI